MKILNRFLTIDNENRNFFQIIFWWEIRRILYNLIVLFFGFSVFMISEFGGTVALGGLVSITLLFAMFSNLILLPSLLLSLEKSVANKKDFIQPKINILYKTRERFFRNNKTAK